MRPIKDLLVKYVILRRLHFYAVCVLSCSVCQKIKGFESWKKQDCQKKNVFFMG